jgi:transposase
MSSSLPDRLIEIEPVEVPAVRRAPAGTSKTFRAYVPGQVLLMAPDAREWVPDGDLAHFVNDLVEEVLDLSAIYDSYVEERGFPPYDPRLMVKLLVYGYATAITSSRMLETATHRDVAVRMLCAGQQPDYRAIAAVPQASSRRAGRAVRADLGVVPQGRPGGAACVGGRRYEAARQRFAAQGDEL